MKYGYILSAMLGAGFVAGPIALGISIPASIGIGTVAYIAGNLIFSEKERSEVFSETNLYDMLNSAKKTNSEIIGMAQKVDDDTLKADIKEIYRVANKIIETVSQNPSKQKKANNFFGYYLPVTLKILQKYDEIENQKLESSEGKKFMSDTRNMVKTIKESFNAQLSNLYQSDMIDTDADMKVFKTMLKTDGYGDIDDFNIKK